MLVSRLSPWQQQEEADLTQVSFLHDSPLTVRFLPLVLVASKSADPRYEVNDGRKTPPFYVAEVEAARKRILDFLTTIGTHSVTCGLRPTPPRLMVLFLSETRDFNPSAQQKNARRSPLPDIDSLVASYPTNMSYCHEVEKRTPSLALMPVHPHGTISNLSSLDLTLSVRGRTGPLQLWYRCGVCSQELS
jgi:hypothetical protein